MPDNIGLTFRIAGGDLFYTVPSDVENPPVFSMDSGILVLESRGFLPKESVFEIDSKGVLTIRYDFSEYTQNEIDAFYEVRAILGIPKNDLLLDSYILYYIRGVERFIKNYCAVSKVPEELYYVWCEIVAAKTQANKNGFASFANATPSTIKDGSQSVSYGNSPAASAAGLSAEERNEFLNGWGHQLRQFRRFKWG